MLRLNKIILRMPQIENGAPYIKKINTVLYMEFFSFFEIIINTVIIIYKIPKAINSSNDIKNIIKKIDVNNIQVINIKPVINMNRLETNTLIMYNCIILNNKELFSILNIHKLIHMINLLYNKFKE